MGLARRILDKFNGIVDDYLKGKQREQEFYKNLLEKCTDEDKAQEIIDSMKNRY